MPRTVSLPSQEELGCGSHVPVAVHNRTGTSFMATGGKPAYLGEDVGSRVILRARGKSGDCFRHLSEMGNRVISGELRRNEEMSEF